MKFTGEKPPRHPPSSDATPPEEGNISASFVLREKFTLSKQLTLKRLTNKPFFTFYLLPFAFCLFTSKHLNN